MGMSLKKGDELAFAASKEKKDGTKLILAREVVKADNTFVLRDEKGGPVWRLASPRRTGDRNCADFRQLTLPSHQA
jgi:hypothetical protein